MCLYQSLPVPSSDPLYPPIPLSHWLSCWKEAAHTQTHAHKDLGFFHCSLGCWALLQYIFTSTLHTHTLHKKKTRPKPESKHRCNSNHFSLAPSPLVVTSLWQQRRRGHRRKGRIRENMKKTIKELQTLTGNSKIANQHTHIHTQTTFVRTWPKVLGLQISPDANMQIRGPVRTASS